MNYIFLLDEMNQKVKSLLLSGGKSDCFFIFHPKDYSVSMEEHILLESCFSKKIYYAVQNRDEILICLGVVLTEKKKEPFQMLSDSVTIPDMLKERFTAKSKERKRIPAPPKSSEDTSDKKTAQKEHLKEPPLKDNFDFFIATVIDFDKLSSTALTGMPISIIKYKTLLQKAESVEDYQSALEYSYDPGDAAYILAQTRDKYNTLRTELLKEEY